MMRMQNIRLAIFALVVSSLVAPEAWADPCGMVPPVSIGVQVPITRVGEQKTYVFYKDGVETFVIRPGFSGKVDEFGMLIPFPTPPAIRKVPDDIFPHIAAAIDPPEVVINLQQVYFGRRFRRANGAAQPTSAASSLKYDAVKVIRQEAVGMYEVAVLEAGSSKALKRWMDQKGYRFPKGMDAACDDYVKDGWCFVAVKTKVGQKKGVDPQPGQRSVRSKLPQGSTFDGHVQAMGFRFSSKDLVVPMRLSSFNKGELRNIVYLVTDGPRKIRSIPEEYVVRQISGADLIQNVTGPLPLRIIGGDVGDIPAWQMKTLPERRKPTPHNGAAKELLASDLLAVSSGKLSLPHEEREKELLRIGERLGLRGKAIDNLNGTALAEDRKKTVDSALAGLKKMTLTVVDGDFPREVLAKQNLTFGEYKMPTRRNTTTSYDAKLHGPAPKKQGLLKIGALTPLELNGPTQVAARQDAAGGGWAATWQENRLLWLVPAIVLCGLALTIGLRRRRVAAVVVLVTVLTVGGASRWALADEKENSTDKPTIRQLINNLSHADRAAAAVDALTARGKEAVPQLSGEALEGNDMARRGWAIACLAEIGGKDVDELLTRIHKDAKQPMLVRTWAAAGRVAMTDTAEGLTQKADLVSKFPAVGRPLGMRLVEALGSGDGQASAAGLLSISLKLPQLQQALAPAILALGGEKLTVALTTATDQNVRRQAAAYLATLAGRGDKTVASAVAKTYKFDPDAKDVPWKGGPLFVPGLKWQKDEARALAGALVSWHLWCDRNGRAAEQKQIHNNIRSLSLAAAAGYTSPGFADVGTDRWLLIWGKTVGREELRRMLKQQGVADKPKYAAVLEKL